MEYLPTLYEAAEWYAFFCIVTALTVGVININLMVKVRPGFGVSGTFSYLLTTLFIGFIFAPIFALILLFFPNVYTLAVINVLDNETDE